MVPAMEYAENYGMTTMMPKKEISGVQVGTMQWTMGTTKNSQENWRKKVST
jgi:hypothetical protein